MLVETRIGPGCVRLPADFRIAQFAWSDDLIDVAYGFIEAPGGAWRVEWCVGPCGPPVVTPPPLISATPTRLATFWVDAARPEAREHFAEILRAFEEREHPERCARPVSEPGEAPKSPRLPTDQR